MNKWFKSAEVKLQETVVNLKLILKNDNENIECWNPCGLDTAIQNLIAARTLIGVGRYEDAKEGDKLYLD